MAKKKESTLINMLLALFVITAVAGGVLGLVYGVTEDTIKLDKERRNQEAIEAVLKDPSITIDSLEPKTVFIIDTVFDKEDPSIIKQTDTTWFPVTFAYNNNHVFQGMAVKTSEGGFGGKIELMVGFTANGIISGISVIPPHSETPGLGANMNTEWKDQFNGKDPATYNLKVKQDKGDVDAITAATITSRAFTKAVAKAYKVFTFNKPQSGQCEPASPAASDAEEDTEASNETMEGGTENEQ